MTGCVWEDITHAPNKSHYHTLSQPPDQALKRIGLVMHDVKDFGDISKSS